MAASRRITADLHRVEALQHPSVCGVALSFLPTSRNAREIDTVDVFAPLGPEHTLESADGVSTVVRVARAARVAVPREPEAWIDRPVEAADRLQAAVGKSFALDVTPRLRLRFLAWTEDEPIELNHVLDVHEDDDAFFIRCAGSRLPVRVPRAEVVRHETRRETWYQVSWIERA